MLNIAERLMYTDDITDPSYDAILPSAHDDFIPDTILTDICEDAFNSSNDHLSTNFNDE